MSAFDLDRCCGLHVDLVWTQRSREVKEKHKKAVEEVVGSRKDSMIYLDILMVAKEAQGHGYGSNLVRLVTDMVRTNF